MRLCEQAAVLLSRRVGADETAQRLTSVYKSPNAVVRIKEEVFGRGAADAGARRTPHVSLRPLWNLKRRLQNLQRRL